MKMNKRLFKDFLFKKIVILFSIITLIPLFLILFIIVKNGVSAINIDFFTKLPKPPGEKGGGILNAIVGSIFLVIIASILAIPFGVTVGIFLSEVKNKFTETLKVLVDVLQGVPSIVIGIVAYIWIVKPLKSFSALSGGVALGLMMLPIIIKSTQEALYLIPFSLREASFALGTNYTKTILKVILPAGLSGIASGILLGIMRIIGETAPLLFTAFGNSFLNLNPAKPVDALPLVIFNYAMSPYPEWHKIAWGAAFILILLIFILNIIVRKVIKRWKVQF